MKTSVERWLSGALVATVVAAGVIMWQRAGVPARDAGVATVTAPRLAKPALRPAASASAPPQPNVLSALFTAQPGVPLSSQVVRLLASGDPRDAFTAYMLVWACATFNDQHDLDIADEKLGANRRLNATEQQQLSAMCGKMTERERLARFEHLALAIKGGVPGAAWSFVAEGPFGDPSALQTRPNDPLVLEWKKTASAQLAQAAEAGDYFTLLMAGFANLQPDGMLNADPARGYAYLLSLGLIDADNAGKSAQSMQQYAEGSDLMKAMGGKLTPQQRASAMVLARQIAARAKARRERDEQGG